MMAAIDIFPVGALVTLLGDDNLQKDYQFTLPPALFFRSFVVEEHITPSVVSVRLSEKEFEMVRAFRSNAIKSSEYKEIYLSIRDLELGKIVWENE